MRAALLFVCVLCNSVEVNAQSREPAKFMDVFPAAAAGAAIGSTAGYQVGTRVRSAERPYIPLAAAIVGSVIGSGTAAWIAERNDGTNISFSKALSVAATSAMPAVMLAGVVTWTVPAAARPYVGMISFSVLQGTGTAVLAARHSRHSLPDTQ